MNLSDFNTLEHRLCKKGLINLTQIQQNEAQDYADQLIVIPLTISEATPPAANNVRSSNTDYNDWIDDVFCNQPGEQRQERQVLSNEESSHQHHSSSNHTLAEATQISEGSSDSNLVNNFAPQSASQGMQSKRRREKTPRNLFGNQEGTERLSRRSQKNIVGYIAKKSIKMVLKKYIKKITKECQKANLSLKEFIRYYEDLEKDLYGPQKLAALLKRSQRDGETINKMKEIFLFYFERVLRKDYLMQALRSGKMTHIQSYLWRKNTCLLYFAESL